MADNRRKIRSSLADPDAPRDLRSKYEEIYASSDVWLYKKSHGVHSVIFGQIADLLTGARVLDIGCGAGRLALMCATRAAHVDGIDFSESAVRIARLNAQACGIANVAFEVTDLESFLPSEPYDLATMVGVLEHVPDPVASLENLNQTLRPDGIAVVSCPNFLNFRGHTYMTLLTLLDLPMSLADLRQVDYTDMRGWCAASGFVLERSIGAIYRFAWTDKAVDDMVKRVPAAAEDKGLSVALDYDKYGEWLRSQVDVNDKYLQTLHSRGLLRRITRDVELVPRQVDDLDPALWASMRQYLKEDIESDPFYSDVEPFCYQGGECIYLLRKQRGA